LPDEQGKKKMMIRCWGARGSIPVCGQEYIKYGGDTTCIEIRTHEDEIIIIDAGTGIRKLGNHLLKERRYRYHMIFTHSHWDHILGFPFFKPLYRKETSIRMFGCPFTQESVRKMIAKVMTAPNFPVDFANVQADISYQEACENTFSIKSMEVTPILTSHPNPGIGYKFVENGRCFVFLTDNELAFKHPGGLDYIDYVNFSSKADLLIHDSEYTEEDYKTRRTWGHSAYPDALKLALDAQAKKLGLFHHNQDRTDTEVDEIVQDCRRIIENNGARLECFAVSEGMEISL
jgi:phosphoribosyl 1,2-cyclic phosphodiesterase